MKQWIHEIRDLIRTARLAAAQSVDLIQVLTNFEIGRRIVEHEQQGRERAEYGEAVLSELAIVLTEEFGRGFSLTNLKMIRRFYLTYHNRISQTPSGFFPASRKRQTVSDLLQSFETPSPKAVGGQNAPALSAPFTLSWSHYVFLIGVKDEAPTVGIVLCKKNHEALVEITLPQDANIHAREYRLYLPDKELLRRKLAEWAEEVTA